MDDSHRQQQAALAGKPMPEPTEEPEGDDMGDSFKIAGDTTTVVNHNYPKPDPPRPAVAPVVQQPLPPDPTSTQPQPPEPEEPEWKKWAKRAALAAAGAGLAGGYQWWNAPKPDDKPPAVTQPAVDGEGSAYWKYGVRVRPPGE